ncbi:sugar ABC transporter ATP-binding protein [Gemmobacter lanyuensis]
MNDVSFELRAGTVHALMGENGAGKSTLMKVISGIYRPDGGTILLNGREVELTTPLAALDLGIAMIHQELNLMAPMTVAENIWIRREPRNRLGLIDHAELNRRTAALFAELDIRIDPDRLVGDLSVANRQMVEIAKAVSYNSQVLIMDEPTSTLTEREVEHLFRIINTLRAKGTGIIYITHKMNELFEIADEVSVFRDGEHIATRASSDLTRDDVIRMMVGRDISQMFPKVPAEIGDVVLSVRNLTLRGVFDDISFDLRAGEILGVAGLVGRAGPISPKRFWGDPGDLRVDACGRAACGDRYAAHRDATGHGLPDRRPQGYRLFPEPDNPGKHADCGAAKRLSPQRFCRAASSGSGMPDPERGAPRQDAFDGAEDRQPFGEISKRR